MKKDIFCLGGSILFLALSVVLSVTILPVLSVWLLPVSMAICTVFVKENKIGFSIAYSLFVCAAYFLLFGAAGIIIGGFCLIFGLIAGKSIANRNTIQQTTVRGAAVIALLFIALFVFLDRITEGSLLDIIFNAMQTVTNQYIMALEQGADPQMLKQLETAHLNMVAAIAQVRMMIPALLVIYSSIISYLTLLATSLVCLLFRTKKRFFPRFSMFHVGRPAVYFYFAALLTSLFLSLESPLGIAMQNMYTILEMMLTICAVSLIDYLLIQKKLHVTLRALIILSGILLTPILPFAAILLNLVAFVDSRADFRGLEKQ